VFEQLVLDIGGGLAHCFPGEVGGAAGVSTFIERREVCVRGIYDDVVKVGVEHFGGDLRQHGIRTGAQVGGAHEQVEGAVIVHLERGGGHIQVGHARAVHHHRHADTAAVAPALPAVGGALGIKIRHPAPDLHALLHAAGSQLLAHARAAFAELLREVHFLAHFYPVLFLEVHHIQAQLIGDLAHEHFDAVLALHAAITAVSASHGCICIDNVANKAGVG